jgi:hypothetical protein
MSDVPFYRTQMGHRFYERTMPELVRQLTRLNTILERVFLDEAKHQPPVASEGDRGATER